MSRVYHFVPKKWALCDIRNQRLKVATFDKMNDPFELLGVYLGDKNIRRKFQRWRSLIADKWSVLCFSADWKNPLLWSHYADRHRGICLGFDVPDNLLHTVQYRKCRPPVDHCRIDDKISPILYTKFAHWEYENERRRFVKLQDCRCEGNLYFWPFGNDLNLREVIVGSHCESGRSSVEEFLGDMRDRVKLVKAREAFREFSIVKQLSRLQNSDRFGAAQEHPS